jgi:hypothetical protein
MISSSNSGNVDFDKYLADLLLLLTCCNIVVVLVVVVVVVVVRGVIAVALVGAGLAANTTKLFVLFCSYRFIGSSITANFINLLNPIGFFTYHHD